MKKLIGKDIIGRSVVVECEEKDIARVKRQYAKAGIGLRSYDAAIKREAKRLLEHSEDAPEYSF